MMLNRCLTVVMFTLILSSCTTRNRALIPQQVMLEQVSPDGDITAIVYTADTGKLNLIGAEQRAYLGIRYPGSELILRRELTESFGEYEGGVLELKWISNHEILVKRAIADQRKDIVFDVTSHKWRTFQNIPSPIPENTTIGNPDCP